ncbi:MAG: putative zinc-binding peptidase [Verrucomicrobia bacterium]|nr:putative zinc-binding peptidase [Verrucomicrobiota bacterium]MCH8514186.1 putative zinc-binding peptidase [Kiritimatiellia bacterium]
MKLFSCTACGNRIYFENVQCTSCGATLGFVPDRMCLAALEPADAGSWRELGGQGRLYRKCANYEGQGVCNWMIPVESSDTFCMACALNQTIPDLNLAGNRALWAKMEAAKRRLVISLLQLGLPLTPQQSNVRALAFDFLADTQPTFHDSGRVLTGHKNGLITLNIAEADPVVRAKMREQMDEPYRTLLGHFRHEAGHYYWDLLIRDTPAIREFRERFGDERLDYGEALALHHRQGPPPNWRDGYVSAYASCHPWEDWAESWAHVLHILDTLETAMQFGLRLQGEGGQGVPENTGPALDPFSHSNFNEIFERWMPLTFAMNSLNRSMGHDDAYPFVLQPGVVEKLAFVHRVARGAH